MRYFPAILEKTKNSDYGLSFPDFPGCITAGSTAEEALTLAEEALQFHVDGMVADGAQLPSPTSVDSLILDPEIDLVAVSLVPVRLPGKSTRINITMDENLLLAVDTAAATEGYTRSAFLAEAVRTKLAGSIELRLAEMPVGERVIDSISRLIREDEKKVLRDSHPPNINKLGRTKRH